MGGIVFNISLWHCHSDILVPEWLDEPSSDYKAGKNGTALEV